MDQLYSSAQTQRTNRVIVSTPIPKTDRQLILPDVAKEVITCLGVNACLCSFTGNWQTVCKFIITLIHTELHNRFNIQAYINAQPTSEIFIKSLGGYRGGVLFVSCTQTEL